MWFWFCFPKWRLMFIFFCVFIGHLHIFSGENVSLFLNSLFQACTHSVVIILSTTLNIFSTNTCFWVPSVLLYINLVQSIQPSPYYMFSYLWIFTFFYCYRMHCLFWTWCFHIPEAGFLKRDGSDNLTRGSVSFLTYVWKPKSKFGSHFQRLLSPTEHVTHASSPSWMTVPLFWIFNIPKCHGKHSSHDIVQGKNFFASYLPEQLAPKVCPWTSNTIVTFELVRNALSQASSETPSFRQMILTDDNMWEPPC